jgi:hypothetical protein
MKIAKQSAICLFAWLPDPNGKALAYKTDGPVSTRK